MLSQPVPLWLNIVTIIVINGAFLGAWLWLRKKGRQ